MISLAKVRKIVDQSRDGVDRLFLRYGVDLPVTPENVYHVAVQLGSGFISDLLKLSERSFMGGDGSPEITVNNVDQWITQLLGVEPGSSGYSTEMRTATIKAYEKSREDYRKKWLPYVIGIIVLLLIVIFILIYNVRSKA